VAGTGRCDPQALERRVREEENGYALVGLWAQDRAAAARVAEDVIRLGDKPFATLPVSGELLYPSITILIEERPSAELAAFLRARPVNNPYVQEFLPMLSWSQPHDDQSAARIQAVVNEVAERESKRKIEEAIQAAQAEADRATGTTGARGNGPPSTSQPAKNTP
jgi:hypothetical protein